MGIKANITDINSNICIAKVRYHRTKDVIKLIVVSKTRTVNEINKAYQTGLSHFGENYCQEAVDKIKIIDNPSIKWHFIGPIQSNKTKQIANYFDWVHTIDRIKIAQRLNDARPENSPPMNVCVQINISGETSKSGIKLQEVNDFIEEIKHLKKLKLRGLMALPSLSNDFNTQKKSFAKIRLCLEKLKKTMPELDTLSIGTSQDMEAAIAEGATMLRIGTAIFGSRNKNI